MNMEEFKAFIEKLKCERKELIRKRTFMAEHKFIKEQEHIQTKIDVIQEIISQSEWVTDGTKKADQINFEF
mgnify:FL=1|jgi:hypothetical protein